jgi:hypothetical protein
MWVDAIKTRLRGMKLSAAELEAMVPVRGRLWVSVMRGWGQDGEKRPLTASLLGPRSSEGLIWQLDRARVKVRDGQIMVLGYEDLGTHYKHSKLVPQVWWCDPIRSPVDEVEARAKARFPPAAGKGKLRPAPPLQDPAGMVPAWVRDVPPGDPR